MYHVSLKWEVKQRANRVRAGDRMLELRWLFNKEQLLQWKLIFIFVNIQEFVQFHKWQYPFDQVFIYWLRSTITKALLAAKITMNLFLNRWEPMNYETG